MLVATGQNKSQIKINISKYYYVHYLKSVTLILAGHPFIETDDFIIRAIELKFAANLV